MTEEHSSTAADSGVQTGRTGRPGRPGGSGNRLRELAASAVLGLIAILLTLVALDVVLRLGSGDRTGSVLTHVEEIRESVKANQPHRRQTAAINVDAEPFKVLFVGDSFTWGHGVYKEAAYPAQTVRLLQRLDPTRRYVAEVLARPGWNTEQVVSALRSRIVGLAPDLVVLGYCLNDAEPSLGDPALSEGKIPLLRREPEGLSKKLNQLSQLYRVLWNRLENRRQRRAHTQYYRSLYQGGGWTRSRLALGRFTELVQEVDVPSQMIVFPIFDSPLDERYPYRELHREVLDGARIQGQRPFDLLPVFAGVDTARLAVTPFTDPHPNELAHRLAAQALVRRLVRQELVEIGTEQLKLL